MQNLLRITVLGIFAAAGVALAVPVALHSTSSVETVSSPGRAGTEPAVRTAAVQRQPAAGEPDSHLPLRNSSEDAAPVNLRLGIPSVAQWKADYQPPVSRQLDFLQQAIEQIQDNQSKTADVISKLREDLPSRKSSTDPPHQQTQAQPGLQPARPMAPSGPVHAPVVVKEPTVEMGASADRITINMENSDIRDVLPILGKAGGLNILSSPNVAGTISASLEDVDVGTALDAILRSTGFVARHEGDFVYVGTPEDLQGMVAADDRLGTRVYRPNYITASEIQQLITPMLSVDVGVIAVSTPSEVGIASNSELAGGDSFAGEEVLLVRDFETILAEIDKIIAAVDRMPMQVAIEAMILSVKLDDKNHLGVDFELLRNKDTIRISSGTAQDALLTASFNEGLKIGFLDSSLFAFIDALETIGDTNVIASPRLLCLNKQRAEILIGSELGYVSTTITETAATQTVEFLEVGTHLRIRPFISHDGMVRLEVHPELSQGSVRVESGFTLPDKEVTQVTTNVMCRSHSTVVIGGLIREDLVTTASQIPVLGNLPLVGAVFRERTEDIERREIIVLLTPRVIDEVQTDTEGKQYANQFGNRRDVFLDKMSPLGKRRFGEQYARLATAAWAAGDADVALRYANLAVHFDPLHQQAVNVRHEILSVHPELEVGVHRQLKTGLAPWEQPHRDYSRQGWPTQLPSAEPSPGGYAPVPQDAPVP